MPDVAIVIALRTAGDLSADTLASIRAQTLADFECVILCESGAPDTGGDGRCRAIGAWPGGQAAAWNAGIRATTAPFIAFLEPEDAWTEGALQALRSAVGTQSDVALAFGRRAGLDGQPTPPAPLDRRPSLRRLLRGNPVPASAALVRRSSLNVLGFFNETLRAAFDYDLWLRVAHAAPVRALPDVLARRLRAPRSVDEELTLDALARLYLRDEKDWHVPASLLTAARKDLHRRRALLAPTLLDALPHWWRSIKS